MTAANEVRLRIEREIVNTLERSPRVREESSRELLVSNISNRLGADIGLHLALR